MEIKSYKKKSGNIYEVKFDDGTIERIYDDIIIKYELLIDKNITKKKYNDMMGENELLDSYYKALKYISIKMRSEKEIHNYLKKKEFGSFAIDFAIDKLKKEGYIDQERYTKAFINDAINLSLDGPIKIKNELISLGIDSNIIDNYLEQIDIDTWKNKIIKILEKKSKTNKLGSILFKKKMYSYLVVNGYSTELINEVLNNCTLQNSSTFNLVADKLWNKLVTKNIENKEYIFKEKMYSKGFTIDEINDYINKKD